MRGVVGLPLALAAVPMALFGGADAAVRAQRAVIRRFGPGSPPVTASAPAPGPARVVGHSLLVLVPALIAFAAAAVSLFVCWSGYLYFLRPDAFGALDHPFTADPVFDTSWGGPTLVGAWAVHALVALGIQLASLVLIRGLTATQDRTTRRLFRR